MPGLRKVTGKKGAPRTSTGLSLKEKIPQLELIQANKSPEYKTAFEQAWMLSELEVMNAPVKPTYAAFKEAMWEKGWAVHGGIRERGLRPCWMTAEDKAKTRVVATSAGVGAEIEMGDRSFKPRRRQKKSNTSQLHPLTLIGPLGNPRYINRQRAGQPTSWVVWKWPGKINQKCNLRNSYLCKLMTKSKLGLAYQKLSPKPLSASLFVKAHGAPRALKCHFLCEGPPKAGNP